MWIEGAQRKNKKKFSNKQLAEVKGFLEEKDAKVWLANFFTENLGMLVKMMTGIELPPSPNIS